MIWVVCMQFLAHQRPTAGTLLHLKFDGGFGEAWRVVDLAHFNGHPLYRFHLSI